MPKRLTDLFKVGTTVIVKDGEDEVEVWLQKLIPAETAIAIDKASAKRARFLTIKSLPADHDEVVVQKEEMTRLYPDKEALRYLVAGTDLVQAHESVAAEIAASEDWSKDEYLTGLQNLWRTGVYEKVMAVEAAEAAQVPGVEGEPVPELDAESARVKTELEKYAAQVQKEYEKREKRILKELDAQGQKILEEKAFGAFIDGQADSIWLREYRDCQLWLGTREPHDHRKGYFENREEVSGLSFEVLRQLLEAYQELEVEPSEGKG